MQKVIFKFLIISIFSLLGASISAHAKASESELIKADSLYENRQYTEALNIYNKIYKEGFYSPSMLLKMARLSEGQSAYGQTVYYLEQYFKNTDDKTVLSHIDKLIEDKKISEIKYDFTFYANHYYKKYRPQIVIIFSLLILACLAVMLLKRDNKKLVRSVAAFVIILIVPIAILNNYKGQDYAISINHPVLVLTGPSAGADLIKTINKPTKFILKGKIDKWAKSTLEEKEAFILSDDLKKL